MKHLLPAVVYFVAVIFVAHLFAPSGYVWMKNTVSELASQGHRHKWIMQTGFIGFGILLAIGLILKWRALGSIHYPDIPILIYGLSILLAGIFCTAPIDPTLPFSTREAQLHSLFATVAGFVLSGAILWYALIASSTTERVYQMVFLMLIVGISMAFGAAESGSFPVGRGIVQRGLYLVAFIWLALI